MMPSRELPREWRAEADRLEAWGAAAQAATLRHAADDLEAALRAEDDDVLTLAQAAAASGYSEDHLGREIREGRISNAGRPGAPRIRRADLPRKPGRRTLIAAGRVGYDLAADARSLLTGRLQSSGGET